VAANRGLDPRKLSDLVRGELDWIVMKALEKDRNRRYDCASAAALAGCGRGLDADKIDASVRGRVRRQALDWLRADGSAWDRLLENEPDKVRQVIVQNLQHWLEDRDLAGVRGPQALSMLPESERRPWQTLWDDVADTLAWAQRKPPPEKTPAQDGSSAFLLTNLPSKKNLKKFGAFSSRTGHWKQSAIETPNRRRSCRSLPGSKIAILSPPASTLADPRSSSAAFARGWRPWRTSACSRPSPRIRVLPRRMRPHRRMSIRPTHSSP
jgi:hypothetical protein